MKFRNFDPTTNQPIAAVDLIQKLSQDLKVQNDSLDITRLLKHKPHDVIDDNKNDRKEDNDLTNKFLTKYEKIASIINTKSIKKHSKISKSSSQGKTISTTNITEFDDYLNNKYPLSKYRTNEKLSILLRQRINELLHTKD